MEPFKNIFSTKSVKEISNQIKKSYKKFDQTSFEKQALKGISKLELKDRVKQISKSLECHLTDNFKRNTQILVSTLASEQEHEQQEWDGKAADGLNGFLIWPFTQYIEENGLEHFDDSMLALYEMTKRFTAEFAIRVFLEKYPEQVYKKYLNKWVKDPSRHVRRLVSEGTRPNLPWGKKVSWIFENPEHSIYLLERLKNDSEDYVRRSVANHLNDISRIDKKLMLDTISKWDKTLPDTAWIIRHATRSLLKAGEPKALRLNGYDTNPKIEIKGFKLSPKKIKEGESFTFKFSLSNTSRKDQNLLLDYIIHYPKKNGSLSPKAFRLKAVKLKKGETINIEKKVHFKKVTTRLHYKGKHTFEIKVCDKIFLNEYFNLL